MWGFLPSHWLLSLKWILFLTACQIAMHKPRTCPQPEATSFFLLCFVSVVLLAFYSLIQAWRWRGRAQALGTVLSLYWSCHLCVWSWEADRQFKHCTENQYTIRVYAWSEPSFTGAVIYSVFAPTLKTAKGNISR